MKRVVVKFGGTSISNLDYEGIIKKLELDFPKSKIICVLSAKSGETQNLINNFKYSIDIASSLDGAKIIDSELYLECQKEYDMIVSYGEVQSIIKANITAKSKGIKSIALTGLQAGIISNANHGSAAIKRVNAKIIEEYLNEYTLIFVAGFQASDDNGFITTLGRGASDLTAIAIANALKINDVYIYTDVPAIYTADPRKINDEKLISIKKINFEEALEFASYGGKVIHDRAVSLAQKYGTRIHIRESTKNKSKTGTVVCSKYEIRKKSIEPLRAVISREKIVLFSLRLKNTLGTTEIITHQLNNREIKLNSLFQNYSTQKSFLEFVIAYHDAIACEEELKKLKNSGHIENFSSDDSLCEISVIGAELENYKGFMKIYDSFFSSRNIQIQSLYSNGIRISALISKEDYNRYYEEIYSDCAKYIN